MITLDEIMQLSEPLIRQRSTYVLLWMRHVLEMEGTTPEHARRARAVNDELRARDLPRSGSR